MEIARENLESLSYRELQALAKSRSVKANGKKEELIRRILQSGTAQKKNNVPKTPSAACFQQQICDKENQVSVPKISAASVQKKVLGDISLNSPPAAPSMSHKKPLGSAVKAKIAQPPLAMKNAPAKIAESQSVEFPTGKSPPEEIAPLMLSTRVDHVSISVKANDGPPQAVREQDEPVKPPATTTEDAEAGTSSLSPPDLGAKDKAVASTAAVAAISGGQFEEKLTAAAKEEKEMQHGRAQQSDEVVAPVPDEEQDKQQGTAAGTTTAAATIIDNGQHAKAGAVYTLPQQTTPVEDQQDKVVAPVSKDGQKGEEGAVTAVSAQSAAMDDDTPGSTVPAEKSGVGASAPCVAVEELQDGDVAKAVLEQQAEVADESAQKVTTLTLARVEEQEDETAVPVSSQGGQGAAAKVSPQPEKGTPNFTANVVSVEGEDVKEAFAPASSPQIEAVVVVDEDTRNLVAGSQYLHFTQGERRVRCTLTGHEIVPNYMDILNYLGSNKVQRLLVEGPFILSEYEGMFMVDDPADENFVFCELTGVRMFKSRAAVNQHANGQCFQKAMAAIHAKLESR